MIRLLALDIDGTVLDSDGRVPDANRDAIAKVISAGVEVALVTGRRYDFARPVFERLPSPLTLILSNGAILKDCDVLGRTLAHRESAGILFDRPSQGQVVFEAVDWEHPRHGRFFEANRAFISEVVPLEDALIEDPIQVMFTGGYVEMRALYDKLQADGARTFDEEPITGAAYSVALTEYVHRDFSIVDVIRAGCSKGAALQEWAARRGIDRSEVMAIGDNLNDLTMLEFAGIPVLMENALPELKARGWATTASNDHAGVARAIETFILGDAS